MEPRDLGKLNIWPYIRCFSKSEQKSLCRFLDEHYPRHFKGLTPERLVFVTIHDLQSLFQPEIPHCRCGACRFFRMAKVPGLGSHRYAGDKGLHRETPYTEPFLHRRLK